MPLINHHRVARFHGNGETACIHTFQSFRFAGICVCVCVHAAYWNCLPKGLEKGFGCDWWGGQPVADSTGAVECGLQRYSDNLQTVCYPSMQANLFTAYSSVRVCTHVLVGA